MKYKIYKHGYNSDCVLETETLEETFYTLEEARGFVRGANTILGQYSSPGDKGTVYRYTFIRKEEDGN